MVTRWLISPYTCWFIPRIVFVGEFTLVISGHCPHLSHSKNQGYNPQKRFVGWTTKYPLVNKHRDGQSAIEFHVFFSICANLEVSWNKATPSHPFIQHLPWNKPSSYWRFPEIRPPIDGNPPFLADLHVTAQEDDELLSKMEEKESVLELPGILLEYTRFFLLGIFLYMGIFKILILLDSWECQIYPWDFPNAQWNRKPSSFSGFLGPWMGFRDSFTGFCPIFRWDNLCFRISRNSHQSTGMIPWVLSGYFRLVSMVINPTRTKHVDTSGKWGYPQMDGLSWKIPSRNGWFGKIWGTPISGNLQWWLIAFSWEPWTR